MEDYQKTKQYNVYISDSDNCESGSGVLFYPGGESLYVFTCAHVVDDHDQLFVTLLQPVNIQDNEYIYHIVTVSREQIHFFPGNVSDSKEGAEEAPEDIALLVFPKPKDYIIEPTRYCIGETAENMPLYVQGYPHGVQDGTLCIESLDILNGVVFVSVPDRKQFQIRITDNYIDRTNIATEQKGFSGGPIWKKNDQVDDQPLCLLGIISMTNGKTALNSRFFAEKAELIRQYLKYLFGIIIEKRMSEIPDEDVASDALPSSVVFRNEITPILLSENEKWIEGKCSDCLLKIDEFQLQRAIDIAREAIADPRFGFCNAVSQKELMQTLLYCYEIGDLTVDFDALEADMRSRHLVRDYDRRRHMTKSFMQRDYAETLRVAKACIRECKDDKSLFFTAKAFQYLVGAFLENLPEEQTIGKIIDPHEDIICGTGNKVLFYQLIGIVYNEKYADHQKAVRFLNRAIQIGADNIILESLGNAYYLLAIAAATRENVIIDPGKIDRNALYKAREIFLKIWQKADALFWSGTMRRYGLQIFNTFFFYNDCYRVVALYPDVVKYVQPPKDVDENMFWRDIELKHARNELLTGIITVHPHFTKEDIDCLGLEAEIRYCIQQLENIMTVRTYCSPDLTGHECETSRVITLFESRIQSIPQEKKLPFYIHIMTVYKYGILLFGWDEADKIRDCAAQIKALDPSLEKMVRDCLYEIEAPLDEVIRQAVAEFERDRDINSWHRLTQLYIHHRMMDKADEMYRMPFTKYPELFSSEPEYFFRLYIDYITSCRRNLLDALQGYLDMKQLFHDADVRNFVELELMFCSSTFNDPERFETEPLSFVQKGVLPEEEYHTRALTAFLVNLNLKKTQEHFEFLRRYPHKVDPRTGCINVSSLAEIHYLCLIGKIHPRGFFVPNALSRIVQGIDSHYNAEIWHVPLSDSLKNRFFVNRKVAMDACALYQLFQTHGPDFLKQFETIFIPHLAIAHFLDDLSRTNDVVIRSILHFLMDNKRIVLRSPGFQTQVKIRKIISYDESATVIALGMENECLSVLGEPMLRSDLIDKFKHSFIRPNEINSLF